MVPSELLEMLTQGGRGAPWGPSLFGDLLKRLTVSERVVCSTVGFWGTGVALRPGEPLILTAEPACFTHPLSSKVLNRGLKSESMELTACPPWHVRHSIGGRRSHRNKN